MTTADTTARTLADAFRAAGEAARDGDGDAALDACRALVDVLSEGSPEDLAEARLAQASGFLVGPNVVLIDRPDGDAVLLTVGVQ